jgi:hypothetical protein
MTKYTSVCMPISFQRCHSDQAIARFPEEAFRLFVA